MDLNEHYRDWLHRRRPGLECYEDAAAVPDSATHAVVVRQKASHRGIGGKTALRELIATAANQEFLDELSGLEELTYLELGWPVTAQTLEPLEALRNLRTLKIDSPRNIRDFTVLTRLPRLDRLFISNAKHLETLDWLRPLKSQLRALGVEGSMYTAQRIASLKPLEGFALEALFLTNTKLGDQDLSPIATMPNIRFLGTGINAPRAQFFALRDAKPDLQCGWFDPAHWGDFRDPKPPRA